MEVTTRIEEENRVVSAEIKDEFLPISSDAESTDEELEGFDSFNMEAAQANIFELQGCHKIMLKTKVQKQLGVEVGINVSEEFPWKRVKFSLLSQHLFDEIEKGEMLQGFFVNYKPDDRVLLGYAPSLVQREETNSTVDEEPFVLFVTEDDAFSAAAIIKKMETYDRFMMNKKLFKRPRRWISRGSEYEVDLGIPLEKSEVADVEIQTVYPLQQSRVKFEMRYASDVRDGYAELIAGDARFQNVTQMTVNVGIQSAPATVTLEQQTDPTFPSNAWSQYLYEIKEEEDGLDVSSEDEQEKGKSAATSKTVTPSIEAEKDLKPPPEVSERIKYLLGVLEFNQIDMYRNDYPKISTAPIQIYTNPHLKEIFCFADISKSHQRYVSAVDWYPHLTGIVVAAYAFSTKVTKNKKHASDDKMDSIQRAILQPNPILMWSFTDNLNYKLEFESPREVTALSFCPYDQNILIGGTINGQIILWDLQGRTRNLEIRERLTAEEAENRELISQFLAWTIQYNEGTFVYPAAISALGSSQTDAVTEIRWLSRNYYISSNGKIHENHLNTSKSRYFSSLSVDGSVAYWNLDYDVGNIVKAESKRNLPPALTKNESVYKKLDKYIKPVFVVTYPEALTSVVCDEATYTHTPQIDESQLNDCDGKTFAVDVKEVEKSLFRNNLIVGSFFGRIESVTFEGSEPGSDINREQITSPTYSFARVHDGPIVALKKNPFYPKIFVSIGRTVLAVWRVDFPFTPILWRVRPKVLTAVEWSTDRPGVLFLTRTDGIFEAWDLLSRDDNACLNEVLGGGIITALSEHRSAVPKKVISLGDYNSSFRMVALPEAFYKPVPNELQILQNFIEKEISRKKSIQDWQKNWYTQNADVLEEKRKSKAAIAKDLERLRLEAEEAKKLSQTAEDKKEPLVTKSATHYDFEEKLDKKWDELNLKRLIRNLMSRKMVDPEKLARETALEKDRLRYEERKKASINEAISRVSEEIAEIRSRLLPIEKEDIQLSDTISASAQNIFKVAPSFTDVESEAKAFLDETPPIPTITYDEIMARCRERRELLNKVLGEPLERTYHCEEQKKSGGFKDWNLGNEEFLRFLDECRKENIKSTESPLPQTSYSDLDVVVPEKDLKVQ